MINGIQCMLPKLIDAARIWLICVKSSVRIPFASPKHASIAKQVIEVDPELQPQAVKRTLVVENDELIAYVACISPYR